MTLKQMQDQFRKMANPKKAVEKAPFFGARPGQYGEKDQFLGITVPQTRNFANNHRHLSLKEITFFLKSPWHEERLLAVLLLRAQFQRASEETRSKIFNLYLRSTRFINNWDLIDTTAPHVVGAYLDQKPRAILYELAESKSLWERRIAILATFYFIRHNDFTDTLAISKVLLKDPHDLIHKAVGWLLREIGKRDLKAEEIFLKRHFQKMPRTMLRYAIEKFPKSKKEFYMRKP